MYHLKDIILYYMMEPLLEKFQKWHLTLFAMKLFICTFKGILSKAHNTLFWHQVITKQIHVIMWLMPLYKWPQSKTSAISHVWALAVAGLLVMSRPSSSTGVSLIWNSSHVTNTSSFPQNTLFKKSVKGKVLLWKLGEMRYLWFSFFFYQLLILKCIP